MIRKYEVMYILDQDVKNAKEIQEKLHGILATGGKIIESKDWGLMNFAYEINHKKKGYYTVVIVETTTEAINEFKRITGIDKSVIRSLVLNTENVQNYEQSTELSKTDMTKFEEERRERKNNFKKPFVKNANFNNTTSSTNEEGRKPFVKKNDAAAPKTVALAAKVETVNADESKAYLEAVKAKYAAKLEEEAAHEAKEKAKHEAALAAAKDEAEKEAIKKAKAEKEAAKAQMSTEERAKLDGSDSIEEARSELQKHANALRSLVPAEEKKIHAANLRDMTKKELIKYMKKVHDVLEK